MTLEKQLSEDGEKRVMGGKCCESQKRINLTEEGAHQTKTKGWGRIEEII